MHEYDYWGAKDFKIVKPESNQQLTFDIPKDKFNGCFGLGLASSLLQEQILF